MKRKTVFGIVGMVLAAAAWAGACPIDGAGSYFTGATQIDAATGKLLYQHKCQQGHTFWTLSSS